MNIKDLIDIQKKIDLINENTRSVFSEDQANYFDEGGDTFYGGKIPSAVITAKRRNLPNPLSPKGRDLAKKYANRISSGNMSLEAIPDTYRKTVNNYLEGKMAEDAARDRRGYEGILAGMNAAVGGLPGLLGYAGSEAVNTIVNKTTGKNSWGEMIYSGDNPVGRALSEISNPGNLLGGIGAARDITSRYEAASLQKGNYMNRIALKNKAYSEQLAVDKAVADIYNNTKQPLALPEPTAAMRRSFDNSTDGSTYASKIPKRYLEYVNPDEIYMTPRVITKLPYKKNGKYLEKKMTMPFEGVRLNLMDINQGANIYSFEDLNKIVQKAYDDSYKILQHGAKGRETGYPKSDLQYLLKHLTLNKLAKDYPDLPMTVGNGIHDGYAPSNGKPFITKYSDPLKDLLYNMRGDFDEMNHAVDSFTENLASKRKSLRQIRALKKLFKEYEPIDTSISKETADLVESFPNIKGVLKKSPQYAEDAAHLIKNAQKRLSNPEDIEKDVITNLLLQRHKFVRGATLENDTDEFIRKVFTTIPDRNYAGRSDFNAQIFDPNITDAMYTSNSLGTALGYADPRGQADYRRVAIIGKTKNDLDLSGDISTWWDKNRLFDEEPLRPEDVDPDKFYFHKALSTNGPNNSRPILDETQISNFIHKYPGSQALLDNMEDRGWMYSTKTLRSVKNPFVKMKSNPFSHYLFIGPKGKSIPGYKILKLYDPDKEWIDMDKAQKITRRHVGNYSKGFSKGMKYGGFLKNF